jgi:hypothetical protein
MSKVSRSPKKVEFLAEEMLDANDRDTLRGVTNLLQVT